MFFVILYSDDEEVGLKAASFLLEKGKDHCKGVMKKLYGFKGYAGKASWTNRVEMLIVLSMRSGFMDRLSRNCDVLSMRRGFMDRMSRNYDGFVHEKDSECPFR